MIDTLHVAALPYPTSQGTQAAIGMMLAALVREGRSTALLTYRAGVGVETRFTHLVPSGLVKPRSMRSGPSFGKIAADVELAAALRKHAENARVVVAHHVEAAAIAHALGLPRWVFVAHTDLGPELPTYFPSGLAPLASRAGHALDRSLARSAPALAAISPRVADALATSAYRHVTVLPVPLAIVPPSITRAEARRALGLSDGAFVALYAGNLDAYQGLDMLVDALVGADTTLLVATESDARALGARLAAGSVAHRVTPLPAEADRARVHAAADFVVIPRLAPGGLPIKLLDALARGVPVLAMERALAGFALHAACMVTNDSATAFARGLRDARAMTPSDRQAQVARGANYLAVHHTNQHFVDAMDVAIRAAAGT